MKRALTFALTVLLILLSGGVAACVMGSVYNLPIPFGLYASGSAAALVASFVIVAFVLKAQRAQRTEPSVIAIGRGDRTAPQARVPRGLVRNLAGAGLVGLLLTIVSGVVGSVNPLANFGMTLFWIIFSLGLTYVTALVGDIYALMNPWRTLCEWLEQFDREIFRGVLRYP